jgi:hypothetical protein
LLENATEALHNLIEAIFSGNINMLDDYLIIKTVYTLDSNFVLLVISLIA